MSIIKYCIAALATVSCLVAAAQSGSLERECWLDHNFAERQAIGASPATLDISALPAGLHWFTMCVKDDLGLWSPAMTQPFVISHVFDDPTATSLQGGEYWLDLIFADRQPIDASPTTIDISALPAGLHWFTMRVKDDLGVWSPAMTQAFVIPHEIDNSSGTQIQRVEVWFDNNYAERQAIGASPVTLNISALPAGLHSLTIRAQDDLGRWSSQKTKFFIIPHNMVEEDVELVRYCYWFDDDTERLVVGTLPVSGKTVAGVIEIDKATVPSGQHTIYWMVGDSKGAWTGYNGEINSMSFYNSRGDADMNGEVGISDVSLLIDYLLYGDPTGIDMEAADCDFTGDIGISDVSLLIDYLLMGHWGE